MMIRDGRRGVEGWDDESGHVRRRFWCRQADREVEVIFTRRGSWWRRTIDGVHSCTVFEPSTAVECDRRCVDPDFRSVGHSAPVIPGWGDGVPEGRPRDSAASSGGPQPRINAGESGHPAWHPGCTPEERKEDGMRKRILVAVDQTPPSELVDLVRDAARGGGTTVRLIHVAPIPDNVIGVDGHVMAYSDQEGARLEAEGLDRLRNVELELGDVPVDSVVRFGDPATEIVREAEAFGADLIAMPTRGRTGVTRLLFGSVAAQVARRAPTAVALVRSHTSRD